MQVSKPITYHLPGKAVAVIHEQLLNEAPKYKVEYFYAVLRYLTVRETQREKDEYYFINYQKLTLSTVSNIAHYIGLMHKWRIIESGATGDNYGYRLNPEYTDGVVAVEIPVKSRLYKKTIKANRLNPDRNHANRLQPHIKALYDANMAFEMDYDAARDWINKNADHKKLYYYHTMLDIIQDKRFRFFKRSKTNDRVFSNITSLKKELRQFIKGDYVQMDLSNAQPFFLGQFLLSISNDTILTTSITTTYKQLPLNIGIKQFKNPRKVFGDRKISAAQKFALSEGGELLKFASSCINGIVYEEFLKELEDTNLTRDDAKKTMLAMLYSRNVTTLKHGPNKGRKMTPYSQEKKKFRNVYPTIYKMLVELKHQNHAALPIFLQSVEAFVFLDCIVPKLLNKGITPLTIHDSIVVPKNAADDALEVIKDVFMELFAVIPTFHVENI